MDLEHIPRKRRGELSKNAPSACTVHNELDTVYRTWPDDVRFATKGDAPRNYPADHAKLGKQPDIPIKIQADIVRESDDIIALREKFNQTQLAYKRLVSETQWSRQGLEIARAKKRNFEVLALLSREAASRSPSQHRFLARQAAETQPRTLPQLPIQLERSGKRRGPAQGLADTILQDVEPLMPTRVDHRSQTRVSGAEVLQQHVFRTIKSLDASRNNTVTSAAVMEVYQRRVNPAV
jgi:hypothetical protein